MKTFLKPLLVLGVLLASFQAANAIRCYVGSSLDNSMSEFNCGSQIYTCLKITTEPIYTVTYSCGFPLASPEDDCDDEDIAGVETETCICDEDLCNSAHSMGVSKIFALLLIAFAMLMK